MGYPSNTWGLGWGLTFTRALATSPVSWQLVAGSWARHLEGRLGSPVTSWPPCFGMKGGWGNPKGEATHRTGAIEGRGAQGSPCAGPSPVPAQGGGLEGAGSDAQAPCPTPALPAGHGLGALAGFAAGAPSHAPAPGAFGCGDRRGWRKLRKEPQPTVAASPALFMLPTHPTSCAYGSSPGWCCQKPLHAAGCTQGRWGKGGHGGEGGRRPPSAREGW